MTRPQLEHILRASGAITDETEIVILGSQSILGKYPQPPEPLSRSIKADAFPLRAPEKADLIDGTIGELSPFHETHGYYAHGITPETTVLANGWRDRLIPLQTPGTNGVVGLCLAPVDLAISKLAASREKDLAFVRVMIEQHLIDQTEFVRLASTLVDSIQGNVLRTFRSLACPAEP